MNAEIAVLENETIERGPAAVCRHDVWDEAQERLLGLHDGSDGVIVSIPVASILDYKKVACGRDGNIYRKWFRLLFKEGLE